MDGDAGEGVPAAGVAVTEIGDPVVVGTIGLCDGVVVLEPHAGAGDAVEDFGVVDAVHYHVLETEIGRGGMGAALIETGVPHTVDALAHSADGRAETMAGGVGDAEDASFRNPSGGLRRSPRFAGPCPSGTRGIADEQVSREPAQIDVGISGNKVVLHGVLLFGLVTLYHR